MGPLSRGVVAGLLACAAAFRTPGASWTTTTKPPRAPGDGTLPVFPHHAKHKGGRRAASGSFFDGAPQRRDWTTTTTTPVTTTTTGPRLLSLASWSSLLRAVTRTADLKARRTTKGFLSRRRLPSFKRLSARRRRGALCASSSSDNDDERGVVAAKETREEDRSKALSSPTWRVTKKEAQKVLPLALIFFCVLFNYTILRDTKDVLVVTAPKSGAEIIPFLKTYVNLPGAVAFTVLFAALSNRFSQPQLFRGIVTAFLSFFITFAGILYPAREFLHPHALCDALANVLPAAFAAPIAIVRNWTFSIFYMLAELWGSVVASLLFWGLANSIMTVPEAKKYYPIFGLFANVALVFSGQFVRYASQLRATAATTVASVQAIDPWASSLKMLVGGVACSGAVLLAAHEYVQRKVVGNAELVDETQLRQSKAKNTMSVGESFKTLAANPYIRNLATLVVAYGLSINIVEVTWKAKLKERFPDPTDYASYMGQFSSLTGAVTFCMMLVGRFILAKFPWGVAAAIPPVTLLGTGALFFSLIMFPHVWAPLTAVMGLTPLTLAVFAGTAQNIASKSTKYSLFDPCKEIAYIKMPDQEMRTKGKAAVDVIGGPLGKSGGSLLQQALILSFGSLAASTPYLGAILLTATTTWLRAVVSLARKIDRADGAAAEAAEAAAKADEAAARDQEQLQQQLAAVATAEPVVVSDAAADAAAEPVVVVAAAAQGTLDAKLAVTAEEAKNGAQAPDLSREDVVEAGDEAHVGDDGHGEDVATPSATTPAAAAGA